MSAPPAVRPSARVLLLDAAARLLLFCAEDPALDVPRIWFTPGGGLEPGETFEEAALRELTEETGLTGVALGPHVWTRRVVVPLGGVPTESIERFYVARVEAHEVDTGGFTALERSVIVEHRWWELEGLRAAAASPAPEVFAPRRIADLAAPIVAGRMPAAPLEIGW